MISTHQADQILLRFAGVADEHAQRFLERLRQLRRLGVPSGVPKGRGVASGRTFEQMIEAALAIRLLQAGLTSTAAADLVSRAWPLARSVLILFDPELNSAEWPEGPPTNLYWVMEPEGLADYRDRSEAAQPRLTTFMLFRGQRLEEALKTWPGRSGSSIILVEGREMVTSLMAAFAAEEVEPPDLEVLSY